MGEYSGEGGQLRIKYETIINPLIYIQLKMNKNT